MKILQFIEKGDLASIPCPGCRCPFQFVALPLPFWQFFLSVSLRLLCGRRLSTTFVRVLCAERYVGSMSVEIS